jgi:hypothetical protein
MEVFICVKKKKHQQGCRHRKHAGCTYFEYIWVTPYLRFTWKNLVELNAFTRIVATKRR